MPDDHARLGLCFFNKQLFYGVSSSTQNSYIGRIGSIDFNFDIAQALFGNKTDHIQGLRTSIDDLIAKFGIHHLRILLPANMECWATLPKLVYDDASEREAYINILMNGYEREKIHPAWHSLSKDNFKLLQLRTDHTLQGINMLAKGIPNTALLSAFEIGSIWIEHTRPGGSFLTISGFDKGISVSSFILGKLRGATYIEFDEPEDLPYLWLQKAQDLPWMLGLHEQIQVYGQAARHIIDILSPFWDEAGTVTKMDTLNKMDVQADEDTYGFDLSLAYPAVMMALY